MGACQEAAEAAQTGTIQVICRLILSAFSPGKCGQAAVSTAAGIIIEPNRPGDKQTDT